MNSQNLVRRRGDLKPIMVFRPPVKIERAPLRLNVGNFSRCEHHVIPSDHVSLGAERERGEVSVLSGRERIFGGVNNVNDWYWYWVTYPHLEIMGGRIAQIGPERAKADSRYPFFIVNEFKLIGSAPEGLVMNGISTLTRYQLGA
jgi:hypothetical protein